MKRQQRETALAGIAGALALVATLLGMDTGTQSAAAQTVQQGPLPLPTLPSPSLTLPLPSVSPPKITLSPTTAPKVKLPTLTPPTSSSTSSGGSSSSGGAPKTGGRPSTAGEPAVQVTRGPMVPPTSAAALIAANPAADLYPQPPVDPAVTPQARQVAALTDVQHRIQYLQNTLARTRDDLNRLQREPDAVLQLLTALTAAGTSSDTASAFAVADSADVVDTPTGRAVALSAAVRSGQNELTRRQHEETTLRQEINRRIQQEINRRAHQPARPAPAAAAPAASNAGDATRLLRPLAGRLTSTFGTRFDPYYHVWQLHPGADLAAPVGTPIRAAADGRVARSGWYGGYGNYTCIDHGRADGQRLSTCYGHQSRLLVSPGQRVRAGQVIGLVGSTGASTGPHLHFEVRLGGRAVDPLPWI